MKRMASVRRLLVAAALAVSVVVAGMEACGAQEMERWTHRDGREMRAALLSVQGDEIEFLLPGGNRSTLSLDALAEEDQKRVVAHRQRQRFWKSRPRRVGWPTRVSVNWLETEVEVVSEGSGKFVYRSPHFQFEADAKLAPNLVKDFSRIFEVTYAALEENPLGLRLYQPSTGFHTVRLFQDTRGYQRAGGLLNAAGVYNRKTKEILVPFRSLGLRKANVAWVREGKTYDPTALIHEVTHQLLDHWIEVAPIWFNEGMADLMGAARYDSGRMFFDRHEKGIKERLLGRRRENPRVRDLGPSGFEFPLDPQAVLGASQADFMGYPPLPGLPQGQVLHHYHSSLLLVHFFLAGGKEGVTILRRYLERHRSAVEELGVNRMELPERVATQEEQERLLKLLRTRVRLQRRAAALAYPLLMGGRAPEAFYEELTAFYGAKGMHLKPSK